MKMTGAPDPLYVVAREVLLDGIEALGPHRKAIILVGAQAIYLHTGDANLAVVPYTTDADVALNPMILEALPPLEKVMSDAGFRHGPQPGIWVITRNVGSQPVDVGFDLLVPDSLGGGGRRGARLPDHGDRVARKARGLEAVLVDNAPMQVSSLDREDRTTEVIVAGPSALLVAKLHKLGEREKTPERLKAKDAHDVLRLLRGVPTDRLAAGFTMLGDRVQSASVTLDAMDYLQRLFSTADALGSGLAARASEGLEPADVVRGSCAALSNDLLDALRHQ